MLDGSADKEVNRYLEENPKLVKLFEVDVIEIVSPYLVENTNNTNTDLGEPDLKAIVELPYAQEAFKREMEISRRVKVHPHATNKTELVSTIVLYNSQAFCC